jgi:hypothetical protein
LYETAQSIIGECYCAVNNPYYYANNIQNTGFSTANNTGACD